MRTGARGDRLATRAVPAGARLINAVLWDVGIPGLVPKASVAAYSRFHPTVPDGGAICLTNPSLTTPSLINPSLTNRCLSADPMPQTHRLTNPWTMLVAVLGSSVLLAFVTWDWDGQLGGADYLLRSWHVPTVVAEALFVVAVLASGSGQLRGGQLRGAGSSPILTPLQMALLAALAVHITAITAVTAQGHAFATWLSGISWLVHLAFFVTFIRWRAGAAAQVERLWLVLGVVSVAHLAVFFASMYLLRDAPDFPWIQRPQGFTNIRHLSGLMVPAAAAMAICYVTRRGRDTLVLACFAAALYYILLTGSRGGAMGLAGGLAMTLVVLSRLGVQVDRRRLAMLAVLAAALVPLTMVFEGYAFETIIERAEEASGPPVANYVMNGRIALWRAVLGVLAENWLWGVGPTALQGLGLGEAFQRINHPHNVLLQVLVQWGVVGTGLICLIAGTCLARVRLGGAEGARDAAPAVAVLACMSLHGLVSSGFYYPFSAVIFLIAFGDLVSRRG